MKCTIEIISGCMMFIKHFTKIATGMQAILRGCFKNLRGSNVGNTDVRDI
jgi:hypothetical protein